MHILAMKLTVENETTKQEQGFEITVEFSKDNLAHKVVREIDDVVRKSGGEIKYYAMTGKRVIMLGGDNPTEIEQ